MDAASFVFLDETGATTNMVRRSAGDPGRAPGRCCPHGPGAPPPSSPDCSRIIAPLVLNGPMTGKAFLAYVEQFAPALSPGDVV
ncbi:MAG: hypothetical protein U1E17_20370 [Geminicoccaceae bacterium]